MGTSVAFFIVSVWQSNMALVRVGFPRLNVCAAVRSVCFLNSNLECLSHCVVVCALMSVWPLFPMTVLIGANLYWPSGAE